MRIKLGQKRRIFDKISKASTSDITAFIFSCALILTALLGNAEDKDILNSIVTENLGFYDCLNIIESSVSKIYHIWILS